MWLFVAVACVPPPSSLAPVTAGPGAPGAVEADGAAPASGPAALPHVVVYAATGPKALAAPSCDSTDNTLCSLYRVELRLGATATPVGAPSRLVAAGTLDGEPAGLSEPTLSPDESQLVWVERNRRSSRLRGLVLPDGAARTVLDVGALPTAPGGVGRPEWPDFATNTLLLFDTIARVEQDLQLKTVWSLDLTHPSAPRPRLGTGGADGEELGLHDVAVWRGDGPLRAVAFGPVPTPDHLDLVPHVETLTAEGAPTGDITAFDLGRNASGAPIRECHHPAWNYAGDAILCMVHQPAETVDGLATRLLYTWTRDTTGRWTNPRRTFEPLRLDRLPLPSAALFADTTSYQHVTYKYAQWCGTDDWVLATVYASNRSTVRRGEDDLASRLMLIHLHPVDYVDLTSLVEQAEHRELGALASFTGTCSRAR